MNLLLLKQWLPDNLVRAVCWTLIHSLWQGLMLAAGAGLLVLMTRKRPAARRYNLLAALFFVFMGVVVITFINEWQPVAKVQAGSAAGEMANDRWARQDQPQVAANDGFNPVSYIEKFTGYFDQHASLVVAAWFLIFLAKMVKLLGGLVYIQRIRQYKVQPPDQSWSKRMNELAMILGIKPTVQLLQSALVQVPVVAGWLKPVILLPVGLMANLPPAQVEAIILHELAHIRRRDFMINLVQSFAETLFFFNPAVRWLSALLRQEREHCCDDMAIAITQSKTGYIQALVSFQEYQLENTPQYVMAFPGKKDQLLNRVKRIIDDSHKSLSMAEKSFMILCFSLICLLSVMLAQPAPGNGVPVTVKATPTLPLPPSADYSQMDTGTGVKELYKQQVLSTNAAVIAPTVNKQRALTKPTGSTGEPLQADPPGNPVIKDTIPVLRKGNSVLTGTATYTRDGKQYKVSIDNNKVTGLMIDGIQIPYDQLLTYRDLIDTIFRSMQSAADEQLSSQHNALSPASPQLSLQQPLNAANFLKDVARQDNRRLPHRAKLGLNKKVELLKPNTSVVDEIIEDMLQAGLITQTNPLSFRLNEGEFVVNDQAVPASRQRAFREKYVLKPGDNYLYIKQGGTTHTRVDIDR